MEFALRRLMGMTKLYFENSSSRRDLPIPDDWTIEQNGPYNLASDIRRTTCRLRAASALVPIKGVSHDLAMAKKYGIYDFNVKSVNG